jgi:hypothetical protein
VIDPERQRFLLVEDNPDEEALTLRTLHKQGITNEIIVARNGADYLEQNRLQAHANRANSFVRKPIDSAQFGEVLNQLGHYWLRLNEAPSQSLPADS